MTKEELKILLRDFRNMQAQLNYLKELSNDQTISQTTFHEKERMLRLIESALTVLDKRERFVIETHLTLHCGHLFHTAHIFVLRDLHRL